MGKGESFNYLQDGDGWKFAPGKVNGVTML